MNLPSSILQFLLQSYFMTNNDTVDYYVNLITEQKLQVKNYEIPIDASQYKNKSSTLRDYGSFDFIIVGAGAAGTVIANRLSEIDNWNILLLEAGDFENNVTNIPSMAYASMFSHYSWDYASVSQTTACLGFIDQKCPYPMGRGIGGSTIINNAIYSRGNKYDYDKWAEENPGWSYEEVLPYFIKSEDSSINGDLEYHGRGGPLSVEYSSPRNILFEMFIKGNEEMGYNTIDYNGKEQIGVARCQLNTINGKRKSCGSAFIDTINKNRTNLHVSTKSYVTKILIDRETKCAYGVKFIRKGETFVAKAKNEVIISAGSIATPQLLMLSGIGPAKHLKKHKIHLIQDLPVGQQYFDHPTYYGLNVATNYTEFEKDLRSQLHEYLNGEGLLTVPANNQGVGYFQSNLTYYSHNYPDVEILFVPPPNTNDIMQRALRFTKNTANNIWGSADSKQSLSLIITFLNEQSRGTIKLKSSDPFDYPLIDAKLLSDSEERDIEGLYMGIQMALELLNTTAFQSFGAKLAMKHFKACKGHEYLSKDYWYCTIRQATISQLQPAGSCKMGADPKNDSVVDNQLRVYGIKNLRVIDASVFPFPFAGHMSAPTVMLAEKSSDIIKKDYLKV